MYIYNIHSMIAYSADHRPRIIYIWFGYSFYGLIIINKIFPNRKILNSEMKMFSYENALKREFMKWICFSVSVNLHI